MVNGPWMGTDGAEAVDFNWNGKWVLYDPANGRNVIIADRDVAKLIGPTIPGAQKTGGEQGLSQALLFAADKYKCAVNKPNFEGNHTHVSTTACSGR
jgi:hypothetical protein